MACDYSRGPVLRSYPCWIKAPLSSSFHVFVIWTEFHDCILRLCLLLWGHGVKQASEETLVSSYFESQNLLFSVFFLISSSRFCVMCFDHARPSLPVLIHIRKILNMLVPFPFAASSLGKKNMYAHIDAWQNISACVCVSVGKTDSVFMDPRSTK